MTLKAVSKIKYNGTFYEAGEALPELPDNVASQLLSTGSAVVAEGPVLKEPKEPAKTTVASEPSLDWNKKRLLGEARKRGLNPEETATKPELLKMIENTPPANEDEGSPESTPAVTVNPNPKKPAKDEGEDGSPEE